MRDTANFFCKSSVTCLISAVPDTLYVGHPSYQLAITTLALYTWFGKFLKKKSHTSLNLCDSNASLFALFLYFLFIYFFICSLITMKLCLNSLNLNTLWTKNEPCIHSSGLTVQMYNKLHIWINLSANEFTHYLNFKNLHQTHYCTPIKS